MRQDVHLLLSYLTVLEFLVRAIRQEEEIKEYMLERKSSNYPYTKRPEKLPLQKLLDTINSFGKITGYKLNLQYSVAFLYTNSEQTERI
jgi:hypothetical protein